MKKSKTLIIIFFLLTLGFVGLVAGTAIGSLFVPGGRGLAGPTISPGYGVLGILILLVVGGILSKMLSYEKLQVALYISAVAAIITLVIIIYRIILLQQPIENKKTEPERKVTQPVTGNLINTRTSEKLLTWVNNAKTLIKIKSHQPEVIVHYPAGFDCEMMSN